MTKTKNKKISHLKSQVSTRLTWLPKKTFELEITIPKKKVTEGYKKTLERLTKEITIKGFRKGKAPAKLVEAQVGHENIYQETLKIILPQAYSQAISQHKLRPIIPPQITPLKMSTGQDWVLKATAAESPEVELGNWEKAVKEAKTTTKIWTPGKGLPDQKEEKKEGEEQKLNKIFEALLKEATVEISNLIIEDEVNRMLSKLLNEINKLGLTTEQYLSANNKTKEELRKEYRKTAEASLKIEFILLKISVEKKIFVSEEEVGKMIQAVPDEKTRKSLESPEQKAYVASIIRKRKVIDSLSAL